MGGAGGAGGGMPCADVDCSDQNECTTDTCDPADGLCDHVDVIDSTTCDFGGLPGICTAGVCEDAMLCADVVCDDGNECTTDTCDPMNGACEQTNVIDGTSCDFGGLPGVCAAGVCEDAMLCADIDCDDQNECTTDTCDPVDGSCDHVSVTDGTSCDFGSLPGICGTGVCEDAMLCANVDCDDQNECTTDTCDPMNGACVNADRADGTACDLGGLPGICTAASCSEAAYWHTPELISNFVGRNAVSPQVGTDSYGNAIAVWAHDDFTGNSVWASRYTATGGWSTAELVDSDSTNIIRLDPKLAVSANGDALAMWSQIGNWGNGYDLWANRFTPGGGWNGASLVETNNVGGIANPQIAMHSDGSGIAVWAHSDGTRYNIWANRYTVSLGWRIPTLIENDDIDIAIIPQVAIDANGNAIVVFLQAGAIKAIRYTAASGWGTPESIDRKVGVAFNPEVAVDPSGSALAVWHQSGLGGTNNIWANRFTPSEGWGTAELLETNDVGNAGFPQVALDPSGNAIALWSQWDGQRSGIWSNRYTPSNGWETAEVIDVGNTGNASNYTIAFDESGNALALWTQSNGKTLVARRYTLAFGWGAPEVLALNAGGSQVAFDSTGAGIAIWNQHDGTRSNIVTARFEAD
jgi:hypothetical protein